jgi:hypothetical protein
VVFVLSDCCIDESRGLRAIVACESTNTARDAKSAAYPLIFTSGSDYSSRSETATHYPLTSAKRSLWLKRSARNGLMILLETQIFSKFDPRFHETTILNYVLVLPAISARQIPRNCQVS